MDSSLSFVAITDWQLMSSPDLLPHAPMTFSDFVLFLLRASSVYSGYFPTATLPGAICLLLVIVQIGESVLRNCQFNHELKIIQINLDIIKAKRPKMALKNICMKDQ